jgi:histidine triad (HIT) family protein
MADCVFCGIAAGEVPATVVASSDKAVAFRDLAPQAPLHVLVIPRQHMADVHGIREGEVLAAMYDLARDVAREQGVAESGYRLVFNVGPDAGQTVHHAHLHVLGGRRMDWPPG